MQFSTESDLVNYFYIALTIFLLSLGLMKKCKRYWCPMSLMKNVADLSHQSGPNFFMNSYSEMDAIPCVPGHNSLQGQALHFTSM